MMAHHDGDIVTIREVPSNRALRGYNHSRFVNTVTETVFLPFDSEYGIGFKFTDGVRRRLELYIDGSLVTNSLIFSGEEVLERFVDTNKRFKFVPANSEGVGDPTSGNNGKIEVRLYREKPLVVYRPSQVVRSKSWGGQDFRMGASRSFAPQTYGYSAAQATKGQQLVNCSSASDAMTLDCCSMRPDDYDEASAGATVEGSTSYQKFGSTVWRGDVGVPNVFIFNLKGQVPEVRKAIRCPYCRTYNVEHASSCFECGAQFL